MPVIKGLEWTFDTVASTYEKLRPGYVDELYHTVFDYIPIHESSNVFEVGIGGGQATLPILRTGCKLTAVEYGEHFSELCKKKFKDYPNFSVITNKFEDVDFPDRTYDLVFSASAFHWVPEEIGYPKVFSMLKSGGVFARFANHPYRDKGNPLLSAEIDRLYSRYYYEFYHTKQEKPVEYSEEQAKRRALIAEQYGFDDLRYALFFRTRTFSPKEYIALLGTYSDHIAIEETVRTEFFSQIEKAITNHGGSITIYDTMDLQLARKP
ncbi:MAG: class I SAM-dependent methyltransferase [Clostridiaceae bacterium]|nr:class I SAM-dependent methyltransferase [Clostridiaceae bacterium]